MKMKLIFLVLLMTCFSCQNNKTVSDAEKVKIKGEVKEVVNTFFKGCEDADANIAAEPLFDSPDFIYILNGKTFSYKELVGGMKPNFSKFFNQKITIIDEKYAFPDESTVLYTINCTSLTNYKDGHVKLQDPTVILLIFKKISKTWRIIYGVESFIEKSVPGESSKGLNQVELLNQFVGNWEILFPDGMIEHVSIKSLQGGNGLSVYAKWTMKGEMLFEGTGFWVFDAAINKIDISIMLSTGDVIHDHGIFSSANTMEYVNINNAAAYKGISKSLLEFVSANEIKSTTLKDGKKEFSTWKRVK